ncbi:AMP-binding protein [Sphingomonas histidinilytica]|uniref:Fatty-acyl-CoA synthase n=1 Tax=Rhizorhabdus histidinilytica TaxID=439228 RepID=A0A1T5FPA3_9SPHN|nr:class I adenylate-forming enzyme family protein [Rhizorhabdus histidinilytica]MBO9377102.1 AMP-binding protein [Rhizorhabdus histidinilytica]SKB97998.1 fatty-acyl-CoA synthase [Rhizorhabdus histidinilytica]
MKETIAARRQAMADRHPIWREMTLDAYLRQIQGDYGTRPLVITDTQTLSYAAVAAESEQIAAGIAAMGIARGDRVGLLMANYPITVPLLFAIWRTGAVAVAINTLYGPKELEYVLRESGCSLLITMAGFGSRRFDRELDERLPGWRDGRCEALPELKAGLVYDDTASSDFADLLPQGLAPANMAEPHDPAVIMFTSGTTGAPKGVMQTHDNLLRAAYAGAYHQAFEDGRRAVFSLPLYHGFGLVVGLLSGMVVGGSIVPLLRFAPAALLAATERHRATYLMGVPTMTIAMMEEAKSRSYDLSSLSAVHSAAAPTPSWVWREIQETFGCEEIFTSYGQTEVTATIVCTQPGDPIEVVAETQGRIVQAGVAGIPEQDGRICEFKTIDPETGADLPDGSPGELCTRGPMNSLGYFRRPEETSRLFLPGGWIRTGDLGQFRPDGNLFLTGRSKELYKSRGELVSPKELEQLVTTHPAVAQAFFIGMPDDRWGETGCAWIVRTEGDAIGEEALRNWLASRVAPYKMPRDIWFITEAELPKTGTGKVQKNILKEMALAMIAAPAGAG